MGHRTELYEKVEANLGEPLRDYVAKRRGDRASWRRIALEVTARTGIDITGEALRVWLNVRATDKERVA